MSYDVRRAIAGLHDASRHLKRCLVYDWEDGIAWAFQELQAWEDNLAEALAAESA